MTAKANAGKAATAVRMVSSVRPPTTHLANNRTEYRIRPRDGSDHIGAVLFLIYLVTIQILFLIIHKCSLLHEHDA